MNVATGEISRSVQEAATGTEEVTRNIAYVSTAANDSRSAAERVFHTAETTSDGSSKLREEIVSFLSAVRAA